MPVAQELADSDGDKDREAVSLDECDEVTQVEIETLPDDDALEEGLGDTCRVVASGEADTVAHTEALGDSDTAGE